MEIEASMTGPPDAQVLRLLESYASIEGMGERFDFAVAHLQLLSSIELRRLVSYFEELGEADGLFFEKAAELDALRYAFAKEPDRFPIGSGPIEQIAARVEMGEISFTSAIAEVCAEGFEDNLAPVYAHVIRMWATKASSSPDFGLSVIMILLLAESCINFGTTDRLDTASDFAMRGLLDVATRVLKQRPYGRLFQKAVDFGELALDRGLQGNQRDEVSILLHSLGSLHSNPWCMGRDNAFYEVAQNLWMTSLEAEMGPARFAEYQKEHPLPSPAEALNTAISYYERALEYREGEARGETLKAILQCLDTLDRGLHVEVDEARIEALCRESIDLLPRGNYNRNTVLVIAEVRSIDLGDQPYDLSVDGEHLGPEAVLQEAVGLMRANPREALQRLLANEFRDVGSEQSRLARLNTLVPVIPQAYDIDFESLRSRRSMRSYNRALTDMAKRSGWSQEQVAAALFGLAAKTTSTATEALGIELLAESEAASQKFAGEYAEVIRYLRGTLQIGAAVNEFNAGNFARAIEEYGASLEALLDLGLPVTVTDILGRIGDLAGRIEKGVAPAAIDALVAQVLRIENYLGEGGAQVLQQAIARLFRNLNAGDESERDFATAIQMGKSASFSSILRSGTSLDWRNDPYASDIVDELHGYGPPAMESAGDLDEALLVSYSSTPMITDGRTREEKIENARIRLDTYLSLPDQDDLHAFDPIAPEGIKAALGPKTVFLDYFFADVDALQRGIYVVLATNKHWEVYCNVVYENLQSPDVRDLPDEGSAFTSLRRPLAKSVSSFRAALQIEPESGMMHSTARSQLREHFEMLIGWSLWDRLGELGEQGYDHLCISPHGALRYFPMSLLGDGERVLADDWTVTTVPALDHLFSNARGNRRGVVSVLGLSYEAERDLTYLPRAVDEAVAVARQYGVDPILDGEATEKAAIRALLESERIHISAHGLHDVDTPSFQCLFLSPDEGADGRLYAYELMGLDLSGVEIVTLGACETALGRFDVGDNIRGLPAALFLAGASTIVAGLWEVSDEAARTFFAAFHKSLHEGDSRLAAFRFAQEQCRDSHPEARDWAAFQYVGRYQ